MSSIYSEAGGKGDYDITGEVLVGMYYKDSYLHIHVERARRLAAANSNGWSNPYVKTYLLPDKAKQTKQKTSVKKKTLDPIYNETLSVRSMMHVVHHHTCFDSNCYATAVQTLSVRAELEDPLVECMGLGQVWQEPVPWGSLSPTFFS